MMPAKGETDYGSGWRFNASGSGSPLRLDVQAPMAPGNFRFYYQNDCFGSGTANFRYRLQHLYGQYYGFVVGFAYAIFEDLDAWPDTVDDEGPNSVSFARRPLVHYTRILHEDWQLTVGLEGPDIFVGTPGDLLATRHSRAPDGGFNVRWFPGGLDHMQFSTILRAIDIAGDTVPNDDVFGWGGQAVGLAQSDAQRQAPVVVRLRPRRGRRGAVRLPDAEGRKPRGRLPGPGRHGVIAIRLKKPAARCDAAAFSM